MPLDSPRLNFFLLLMSVVWTSSLLHAESASWFPVQKAPKALVCARESTGESAAADAMLVQSVSGLAALAVNEGTLDEMIWVETSNADYVDWKARAIARMKLEERGTFSAWELVDRYVQNGVIKGYILHRADASQKETDANGYRKQMDLSVNVATSAAGLLRGVIVEERDEAKARDRGLPLLLDARGKSQAWCFAEYRDRFNRHILCTQDPRNPNVRDLAIAHRVFTLYGSDPTVPAAMKWLEPLSPILGWNGGDEGRATTMSSVYGHFQTATDWCSNLPMLMAGATDAQVPRFDALNPAAIPWDDERPMVSFVLSDGDNVQWLMGGFARGQEKSWWANPARGQMNYGWSVCFAHLAQLCPDAIAYLHETQMPNDAMIEWGGGYYYPELFACDRANRDELLAEQARKTWALMQKTNTRVIGFNFQTLDSEDAKRACGIIAREMDGLAGILAFQYYPYEGGEGRVLWVKNARGIDIPVVSARYALWENTDRDRAGTPAKIAQRIQESVENVSPNDPLRMSWVIDHCWSYFRNSDARTEDMPQDNAAAQGGERGYAPAVWCADRLPESIRVVSPEELIWRIRMQHDPEGTKALFAVNPLSVSTPH